MGPTPVLVAHADLAREILHQAALPDVRSTNQRTFTIQAAHRNQRDPPADVLRLLVLAPGVDPAAAAATAEETDRNNVSLSTRPCLLNSDQGSWLLRFLNVVLTDF